MYLAVDICSGRVPAISDHRGAIYSWLNYCAWFLTSHVLLAMASINIGLGEALPKNVWFCLLNSEWIPFTDRPRYNCTLVLTQSILLCCSLETVPVTTCLALVNTAAFYAAQWVNCSMDSIKSFFKVLRCACLWMRHVECLATSFFHCMCMDRTRIFIVGYVSGQKSEYE